MPKRQHILLGFIAILIMLNLWYWWPRNDSGSTGHSVTKPLNNYRADDFLVRMLINGTGPNQTASRDLFRPKYRKKPKIKVKKKKGPPPKTPEQLAREAAHAEFATIKCVGIVFRDNRGQAYMEIGTQRYLVAVGDKVGSRFVVERITTEAVYVRDPRTGVNGQILVTGK